MKKQIRGELTMALVMSEEAPIVRQWKKDGGDQKRRANCRASLWLCSFKKIRVKVAVVIWSHWYSRAEVKQQGQWWRRMVSSLRRGRTGWLVHVLRTVSTAIECRLRWSIETGSFIDRFDLRMDGDQEEPLDVDLTWSSERRRQRAWAPLRTTDIVVADP